MSESLRNYLQSDGTVPATCPACGAVQSIPSGKFKSQNRSVEVTCPCGNRFPVFVEFRKAYRRRVNLRGTYARVSSENKTGEIQVHNISMTGVGLTVQGGDCLSVGDELVLRVIFDDGENIGFEVVAEVIHTAHGYAGCRFKEIPPQQEDALVSYLVTIP